MNARTLTLLALSWLVGPVVAAEPWRPAAGPLTTPWTEKVSPENPWPEYPRPQLLRERWMNLNGLWEMAEAAADEAPPVGKTLAGQILVPFPVESALSGVKKPMQRLWYRRTFEVPADWKGQRVWLNFEAVDWETRVWVNGKQVGDVHRGGYDPFRYDITDALAGEGPQELIVGVYDPSDEGTQPRGKQVRKPKTIWYTPTTGIWQTVWLEPLPETHIADLELVPDLDERVVRIKAVTAGPAVKGAIVTAEAFDGPEPCGSVSGRAGLDLALQPREVKLWTPDAPFLYSLKVRFTTESGAVIDELESYFGMRKLAVGPDGRGVTRLLLNDKFVFQYGLLDQGFWPDGLYTPPTDEAMRFDLEKTKELGFNMVRKHVKVEPRRWYTWCDRLGLLVWQDMPSGDAHVGPGKGEITRSPESARQFEAELAAMMDHLRNHPSIVMWVVFNEGWGQFDTARMTEFVRQRDSTRWVNCASGWNDFPVGDVHDVHVYPGPRSPAPEARRAAVLGEFGGLGLPLAGHTWQDKKNWGYRNLPDRERLNDAYHDLLAGLRPLIAEPGLSAAVYTQTTDVEIEVNGLMTYDRRELKLDLARAAAAHRELYLPPPLVRTLLPTSETQPQTWRYTFEQPPAGWEKPDFDAAAWREGPGGFGTPGTPEARLGTVWDGERVWLRRDFDLGDFEPAAVHLRLHHDEDADIFINGILAAKATAYTVRYGIVPISDEGRAALRRGRNVIAVRCRQTGGGQYIDAGLVEIVAAPEAKQEGR